jgi:hypothetical protein
MGVHVILHINPQSINADDWARVHDDTLALLEAWPIPLLGWGVRSVEGVQVPMYMRSLRCDERDPRNAHWSVIGDKGSLQTGECQTLYRDLRHYKRQLNRPFNEDIVTAAAAPEKDDTSGSARVFGDKTQGYPFHFAVLAAAMLVEERFPRAAMVWGNIDRGQAEEARRMAAPILGREMPLPIRVDAPRLIERLRADFKGDALAQAFNRVFLTDVDNRYEAMLHAFPGEEGAREWLRELAHYSSPSSLGVLGLLIAWLNAGRPLREACRLACADPNGPRFSPEELVDAIAATWIGVPRPLREAMDVFRKPDGASHTVETLFGSFLLDCSAIGRRLHIHAEPAALRDELMAAFGDAGGALAERLRDKSDTRERDLRMGVEELKSFIESARTRSGDDPASLATLRSPEEMSEVTRLAVHVMTYVVLRTLSNFREEGSKMSVHLADTKKARRLCAWLLRKYGPTLTEDAWDAILTEEDSEALAWLAALASLRVDELRASQVRRALFENVALRRYGRMVGRDPRFMDEITAWIEEARAGDGEGERGNPRGS